MKIAVNVRLLKKNKLDGIGWFSYHTLKRIVDRNKDVRFYFIFDSNFDKEFIFGSNVEAVVVPPVTRHPFLWWLWLNITLPLKLRKIKPDLFFSPDGFVPAFFGGKIVNVIHDINFVHYPKDLPFFTRLFYNTFFKRFAKKSDRLLTVSQYSMDDIVESYGIDRNKIDVVYNGADEIYRPLDEDRKQEIRKLYAGGSEYLVFVGSLHPRKNIKRLILAFDKFKSENDIEMKLIIVGAKFFKNSEMFKVYEGLRYKNDIIFTGRLEKEQLYEVVASALAMIYVPYFEGFGIPLLEAMNCDVPIVCSNVTSMPEVVGDAAILVNPFDVEEISRAIKRIVFDENKRNELIEKGRLQRQKFSWDKTADLVWEAIKSVL